MYFNKRDTEDILTTIALDCMNGGTVADFMGTLLETLGLIPPHIHVAYPDPYDFDDDEARETADLEAEFAVIVRDILPCARNLLLAFPAGWDERVDAILQAVLPECSPLFADGHKRIMEVTFSSRPDCFSVWHVWVYCPGYIDPANKILQGYRK